LGNAFLKRNSKKEDRAEYGAKVIATLSKSLAMEFGKGFGKSSLYQFYSIWGRGHFFVPF